MASLFLSPQGESLTLVTSTFLPKMAPKISRENEINLQAFCKPRKISLSVSCSTIKIVRSPSLDKQVVKANRTRFIQKLKTLLLSKPKHFIPLHILAKCRSYLALPKPRSILSMIQRYPSIFELFRIPTAPTPLNATRSGYQLCVRLTPAAAALAAEELRLKSLMSNTLAAKLQKLLMLSSHRRLLLSKLVHLAPDLGLPPNFRSRLCNDHPEKFKIVETSYGRAVELVSWDSNLAVPLKAPEVQCGLIVDRPLKFKHLKLRKGLNLKRAHRDFLIRFQELPDVCPYNTSAEDFPKMSMEAEKRACGVVREVLGMMVEKRTLIDHLTHFRKEFGLSNKLRAMIVRHPELFYVSLKGLRDSVLLVEGFNEEGLLLDKDPSCVIKEKLMRLVAEGKRINRERRKAKNYGEMVKVYDDHVFDSNEALGFSNGDDDDGFDNLFESEDSDLDYESGDEDDSRISGQLWTTGAGASSVKPVDAGGSVEPW